MQTGQPIKTYREYIERCIQASEHGIQICKGEPDKVICHESFKKAYQDALRALDEYPI